MKIVVLGVGIRPLETGKDMLLSLMPRDLRLQGEWALIRMVDTRFVSDSIRADLLLPENLRGELREPLGSLISGEMVVPSLREDEQLISVGDKCTLTFIERDVVPDVLIVDYQIERSPATDLKERLDLVCEKTMHVRNPAGVITRGLWSAIFEAIRSGGKTRIEVDGEEDLATLPCVSLAKNGSQVAYGLPSKGLVLVDVDDESKRRVRSILGRMREKNAS